VPNSRAIFGLFVGQFFGQDLLLDLSQMTDHERNESPVAKGEAILRFQF